MKPTRPLIWLGTATSMLLYPIFALAEGGDGGGDFNLPPQIKYVDDDDIDDRFGPADSPFDYSPSKIKLQGSFNGVTYSWQEQSDYKVSSGWEIGAEGTIYYEYNNEFDDIEDGPMSQPAPAVIHTLTFKQNYNVYAEFGINEHLSIRAAFDYAAEDPAFKSQFESGLRRENKSPERLIQELRLHLTYQRNAPLLELPGDYKF